MARKKNHLHASNSFLAVGLLFVILVVLIMGLSQIKQSLTLNSSASETVAPEKTCNLFLADLKNNGDKVVGGSSVLFCGKKVAQTVHKNYIYAHNNAGKQKNSGNSICTCVWEKGKAGPCVDQDGNACKADGGSHPVASMNVIHDGTPYTYCNKTTVYIKYPGGQTYKQDKGNDHCISNVY